MLQQEQHLGAKRIMDEFKQLPWSMQDVCDDAEQMYHLDMTAFASRNPDDIFFKHLMEIDSTHYRFIERHANDETGSNEMCRFIDPRTGVESTRLLHYVKDPELCRRNIFMAERIVTSKLSRDEHDKCLEAMHLKHCDINDIELTADNLKCLELYGSTESIRAKENQLFLEKLSAHFNAHLSKRYHSVPPSIEQFVMKVWKSKLVELHRKAGNVRLELKTALAMQRVDFAVHTALVHCEQLGDVDEMCASPLRHVRQSSAILERAYSEQRPPAFLAAVRCKAEEMRRNYRVNFQLPISIIKLMLCDGHDWCFRMDVDESGNDSDKTVIFHKPMPPCYLSGQARHRKGAKYVLRSCLARKTGDTNDSDGDVIKAGLVENSTATYKLIGFDEFVQSQHASIPQTSKTNKFFRVFDISGSADGDATDTFRVLIPSKQDTCRKNASGGTTLVNLSPKIEFQAEYGVEVMNKSELIREWCNLYFRPKSVTERVHFDCVSGMVIHQQPIGLEQVTASLKSQHSIESQQLLQRIFYALDTFNRFPAGKYLLRSEKSAANLVKVYATNSNASLTVAQLYKGVTFETNLMDPVHWQRIDSAIVTELHEKHKIIPGCFPHNQYFTSNRIKAAKMKNAGKQRRRPVICPVDDTQKTTRPTPRQARDKEHASEMKRRKRARYTERVRELRAAKNAESSEMALRQELVDDYMAPGN